MLRILVVSNAPSPYNDALFARLARQPGIALRVVFGTLREANRSWTLGADKRYDYEVLRGWTLGRSSHLNPGLPRVVRKFRPDVAVLSGSYTMPTVQLAAALLRALHIPWVYWGEELNHGRASFPLRIARNALRRPLRKARGVLAIGSRARASYERVGVAAARIADFHYYADIEHFSLSPEARREARARMRLALGLPDSTVAFLFCGQLVPRKAADTLLRALARLRSKDDTATVVVAGDGPQRAELERLSRDLGIGDGVRFAGFIQPREAPDIFAAADAFVLPSRSEGWGVVVPEAMAAGLPVLASHRVNAAVDLVRDGETGWSFAVGDDAELAARMSDLCADAARRFAMGEAARAAVRAEAPEPAARRLVTLLEAARADQPLASL